ncbi:MAG TPA: hypothetical protein VJH03_17690 [Blastocatellia bacterium]|nr:hypothetical protein [Blastocatellia bacterium]
MNTIPADDRVSRSTFLRWVTLASVLLSSLMVVACGGANNEGGQTGQSNAAFTNDELEQRLKFDARVTDYQMDGDKLTVNVNKAWMSSPPGLQVRATSQWFAMWQSARAGDGKPPGGLEVVVQHEGEKVARWSAEKGYELIPKEKPDAISAE